MAEATKLTGQPADCPGDEEKHRMTLEALGDVDAGRLVDHEVILEWADNLTADKSL
jgi:hypothetical protein